MINHNYEKLAAENELLRKELAQLKRDKDEQNRFGDISNAAMKEALMQPRPSAEIDHFLASIGRSLEVERIYIFENDPDGKGASNTYEWCAENVTSELENMQNVPWDAIKWWYDKFEQGKDIFLLDIEEIKESEPLTYSYLKPQGIHSLIAKRLMRGDEVVGFFGVDNPHLEFMADISSFLDTLSNFLSSLIQNRNIFLSANEREERYVAELEEKNIELNEALHRAEDANSAKSRFLSSMSHDIRTPLNAIIGMTSIAQEHIDEKERVEDCLQKITVSGKHLLGLINDILDMAKIESGKMSLYMEDLSLKEILDSVSTIMRMQARDRNQVYDLQIHDVISDHVISDSLRLNQVLLNLLGNSVKFTPKGGRVSLELWQEESLRGDEHVRTHIKVEDTGIGMSPEFLKTIFDSFSREDEKVRTTQGTGLGMAITKNIVDMLGGSIEVTSQQGQGSKFHIILDQMKGQAPDIIENVQEPQNTSLKGARILLAEDNDINAEIATVVLEETGALVTRCEDGLLTVASFEESEPGYYHAILMDLRMPHMDGLEATEKIRSMEREDAKSIPIIAMTADAFSDDVQKCMEAGMDSHVSKPIDVNVLKKTLVKLICN